MSSKIARKPLRILIHPMDGSGHVSACTGIGQALATRGHHVTFVVNAVFEGQFAKLGFEEALLHETVNPDEDASKKPENPAKAIAEIILKRLKLLNGL